MARNVRSGIIYWKEVGRNLESYRLSKVNLMFCIDFNISHQCILRLGVVIPKYPSSRHALLRRALLHQSRRSSTW